MSAHDVAMTLFMNRIIVQSAVCVFCGKVGEVSMGCINTITAYKFPQQSEYVNRRCKVCFHYDTTKWIMGTVIRDDREEPYETLIKLDDGRVMRAVECQYSFSI